MMTIVQESLFSVEMILQWKHWLDFDLSASLDANNINIYNRDKSSETNLQNPTQRQIHSQHRTL